MNNTFEISLEDARKINPAYEIGDTLEKAVEPASFGRIAAQTAKQVVVQKIREAERGVVFEQFADKEGEAHERRYRETREELLSRRVRQGLWNFAFKGDDSRRDL